jgi:hypothetical protein
MDIPLVCAAADFDAERIPDLTTVCKTDENDCGFPVVLPLQARRSRAIINAPSNPRLSLGGVGVLRPAPRV